MSAIPTLPDFGLVLAFAPDGVARAWLGEAFVTEVGSIGQRLTHRQLTAVDAGHLSKGELGSLARIAAASFARVYALATPDRMATLQDLTRPLTIAESYCVPLDFRGLLPLEPVATDRRHEHGPFDIVGDVHGCIDELLELLDALGYAVAFMGQGSSREISVKAPRGRRAFLVGDLVDRGPDSPSVLRLAMAMVENGTALCVAGNHDIALLRWLDGGKGTLNHGLAETTQALNRAGEPFKAKVRTFLTGLKGHLWVDGGALAVAHAGVREMMIGRSSGLVRAFSLYGDTDPRLATDGLPTRYHWALEYKGETSVVYGHTPLEEVGWVNNTLCIDTGCCFGGRLTAMRWPERDIVSVPSRAVYAKRGRAFGHPPARPKRD